MDINVAIYNPSGNHWEACINRHNKRQQSSSYRVTFFYQYTKKFNIFLRDISNPGNSIIKNNEFKKVERLTCFVERQKTTGVHAKQVVIRFALAAKYRLHSALFLETNKHPESNYQYKGLNTLSLWLLSPCLLSRVQERPLKVVHETRTSVF